MEVNEIVRDRCTRPDNLEELTQHLLREFPTIDPHAVARQVAHAVAAVAWIGLAEDELLFIELVSRAQLELSCGLRHDAARLDPAHPRSRRRSASCERDRTAS